MRKVIVCTVLVFALLPGGAGFAQVLDEEDVGGSSRTLFIPLTLQDFTMKGKLDLAMPMVFGSNSYGLAPWIQLQSGFGNYASMSIFFPAAYASPKHGTGDFSIGNLGGDLKVRGCTTGVWTFCYGGAVAASVGFIDLTSDATSTAVISHAYAILAHQDPTYDTYETVVVRPLAIFSMLHRNLFAQAEFGTAIGIPLLNTTGRSTAAGLAYQVAVGYKLAFVEPMLEFRGFSVVTSNGFANRTFLGSNLQTGVKDTILFINLGARFVFGNLQPFLRFTFALNNEAQARDSAIFHMDVGTAIQF